MRALTTVMAIPGADEVRSLIDAARFAVARAKALCARAEIACTDAQTVRAYQVRGRVTASRVLSPRGAARLLNDLERASRDLEMLRARIESAKPATRPAHLR